MDELRKLLADCRLDTNAGTERTLRKVQTYCDKQSRGARLQGQWTATKSLEHQAKLFGVEGPIMEQFRVHIERVEKRLSELEAAPINKAKEDV